MAKRVLAPLACVALALTISASMQARQQTPVFRSTTQYVTLDVVVTDRDDRPVWGLNKDDFIVTENKTTQRITDFSEVVVPLAARDVNLDVPPPPPSDVASNGLSALSSRALVVIVDDLALGVDTIVPLRRTLTDLLSKLSDDDQVALIYASRSDLSSDFTNDLSQLIDTANGRRAAMGLNPMSSDPGREILVAMRNALETLQAARQTRRAIIMISTRGCSPAPPVSFSNAECKDLIEKSRRTGVPIYGIDPRLFVEPGAANVSTLKTLAAATGGIAFVGQSDTPKAIESVLNQNGHYYLLGYYPDPASNDGKFHKVDVTLRRPDLTVQTRQGYIATKSSSTPATPKREMTADLGAGLDNPGLPIRVFVAPLGPGAKGTRTAITVELMYPLPPADQRALNDEIRFGALALNPDAKIEGSLQRPSTYTGTWTTHANGRMLINDVIELPSELLTLRVGLSSKALRKSGTTHIQLDVPDFGDKDLVASPVVIGGPVGDVDAATGLDYLRGLVPFQPIVSRTFSASDTLRLFARASWKSSIDTASATVAITGPTPKYLPELALQGKARRDGHLDATLDAQLPLEGMQPGKYVITVTIAVPARGTVVREVPVTIK